MTDNQNIRLKSALLYFIILNSVFLIMLCKNSIFYPIIRNQESFLSETTGSKREGLDILSITGQAFFFLFSASSSHAGLHEPSSTSKK